MDWNGVIEHEVFSNYVLLLVRKTYMVRLSNSSYSCGKWDKSGIPCQHALAVIAFQVPDQLNYIHGWFKNNTYLRAYFFNSSSVKGRRFWPTSEESPLLSPITKRMPSRPVTKKK